MDLVDFEMRSAISKIRVSAHLEIERGWYRKLPVCERMCKYCNVNAVEDEIHFISNCPFYDLERNELFKEATKFHRYFTTFTDEKKTIHLLTSQNPHITEKVGSFVFHCFRKKKLIPNIYS